MIQYCENLVTDGRKEGQLDESDFIGRCPTNVERSKQKLRNNIEGNRKFKAV